ncbi:MAG: transpeptidase family protein [Bacteroides sp.]|nr:transpeptidase family protein [Bacteroides sp.]MBD5332423.1 transpeptidase family protein [Bacteroides sp.]
MARLDNRTTILFRYGLIVVVILVFAARIGIQLTENTVVDADKWNHKADSLMSVSQEIIPRRGNILASDGSVLATNLHYYTARIDYRAEKFNAAKLRENIAELALALSEHFPERTALEWRDYLLKPLEKEKGKRPRAYRVLTNLSHAQMELLKTLPYFKGNRNRTGLYFEKNMRRFNPYGNMARRSIGGVGETSESKEIHGISGLEKALDSLLYGRTGTTGKVSLTKDIADMAKIPAIPGCDIVTTIDIAMQDIVESELNNVLDTCGADWGVAVLMDVKTGDIKAISNLELNPYGPGYIEARNRAVMGYEPGSVIKTLSMMIALEDGIISPDDFNRELPTGKGWAYAGGRPITDSHFNTSIKIGEVLEQSSNIGMARIITSRYDSIPGAFYSRIKRIGFLEPLNTGIAGEVTPRIDSVASNRGGRIALSRQCYGYATEIPPLYTLALYNAIANDGVFVRPRLVKELRGSREEVLKPSTLGPEGRACSPETARTMRKLLTAVVWGEHGTGRFLRNDVVKIAGKTGTCYMIENGTYNTAKKRLAFCGFFPADEPRYSCVVLTCHPTKNFFGAATTSGQVMRNIAMKLYSRGMLGNSSDYNGESPSDEGPTFFARQGSDPYRALRRPFSLPNYRTVQGHDIASAKSRRVPDVRGLSARDAIEILETRGYDVTIKGSGFVRSMDPVAGSIIDPGHTVNLTLTH